MVRQTVATPYPHEQTPEPPCRHPVVAANRSHPQPGILARTLQGRLPNEQALAERFAVNRHTVRQAIQQLLAKGLVRIERGRGTFVQEELIAYRLGKSSRFSHSLSEQHLVSDVDIQSCHFEPASDAVARLLGVAEGAPLLRVEALDLVDGKVVSVCTQYFPLPRFEGFIEHYRHSRSTSEAFARVGITRCQPHAQPHQRPPAAPGSGRRAGPGQAAAHPVRGKRVRRQRRPAHRIRHYRFGGDSVQIEITPDSL